MPYVIEQRPPGRTERHSGHHTYEVRTAAPPEVTRNPLLPHLPFTEILATVATLAEGEAFLAEWLGPSRVAETRPLPPTVQARYQYPTR